LRVEEVTEIFYFVQRDGFFHYREYMVDINPNLKTLLLGSVKAPASTNKSDTTPSVKIEPQNTGRNVL
jgi:hypothetical protein